MESVGVKYNSKNCGKAMKKSNRYQPYNKQNENQLGEKRMFQSPYAPPVTRLLARRFALTGKKYLEVGLNIKEERSFVEIALGEIFKKEITFDLKDWKSLMGYKSIVMEYFESSTITETPPLHINSTTTIILGKYKDIKMVYLVEECNNNTVILAESSFKLLLRLSDCIKSYLKALNQSIETVDQKIGDFKNVTDIKNHEKFNKSSTIDSELLALYFSK